MQLNRIQKRENLNKIFAGDIKGNGGANHKYDIYDIKSDITTEPPMCSLKFQDGARKLPNSIHGVIDQDLLEIVRHRLQGFQSGELSTRETAMALTHIEEALMWLNRRIEDRIERDVLGTNSK